MDGVGGGWGGGGGGWGKNGMVIAASHFGSRAWRQDFVGAPGREGDCEHLRAQTRTADEVPLVGGHVFWLDPLCVHEAVPMQEAARRQFVRLSLPNDAPWFEGYTESAVGVRPTGDILPARVAFMRYRGG